MRIVKQKDGSFPISVAGGGGWGALAGTPAGVHRVQNSTLFRWCRFAQPPANGLEPSGLPRNPSPSKRNARSRCGRHPRLLLKASAMVWADEIRQTSFAACDHPKRLRNRHASRKPVRRNGNGPRWEGVFETRSGAAGLLNLRKYAVPHSSFGRPAVIIVGVSGARRYSRVWVLADGLCR